MIEWNSLTKLEQLNAIIEESKSQPVLLFKHSTRCSISRAALDRLERQWKKEEAHSKNYFVDLLTYREVSNAIAQVLEVEHQSPQVILLSGGKAVYSSSHFSIDYASVKKAIDSVFKN